MTQTPTQAAVERVKRLIERNRAAALEWVGTDMEAVWSETTKGRDALALDLILSQLSACREALEPFAADDSGKAPSADEIWPEDRDHWHANDHAWGRKIEVRHLRRAAALVEEIGNAE